MPNNNERVVNGVRTRVLHGKDYVEVSERVRVVHELDKEFEVIESAPFQIGDRCIWRVVVKVDGKQYIGNAEAKLNAPKNTPDGTNPFECAETSALGRALAFAGLGTVESIASYDEIARAQPFTATIEPAPNKVIESAPSRQQLPAPPQSQPVSDADARQKELITKYCDSLSYPLPLNYDTILSDEAERLITRYHAEYNRRNASKQSKAS